MMKTPEAWKSPLLDQLLSEITPKEQEKVAIKMRVAASIADLLEERGMQKKQLAELCDLKGSSMVTKWLYGAHNFTLETLVDIAFALGVSVADLVRPVEQKVVFSHTVTVQVSANAGVRAPMPFTEAAFVSRSSSAIGSSTMVREPLYHYGIQQPCLV